MAYDPQDIGRLDIRYRIAMPVEVRQGKSWASLQTEDVSFGGLFLRDADPPPTRQLVRLRASLPFGLGRFDASAVVTRRLGLGDPGRQLAGMGLAFYALGGARREQWDLFILEAATTCPAVAETPFRAHRAVADPPESQRGAAVLEVMVGSLEDLFVLHSRDSSRAGIFLETEPEHFAPDQRISLHVVHPATESEFWIPCSVKRIVRNRSRGIAVELADHDPVRLRAFHDALARLIDQQESEGGNLG